jgi:succinyl-CoA synthetase beta subunit
MKIHEYQAKEVLASYGVPTPKGLPAFSAEEAVQKAQELGGDLWVVKAQIHAGGRGKAGGVKLCRSVEDVRSVADQLLGAKLVTHQTGPEGQEVRRLYVESGVDIARELYLGLVLDREQSRVVVMASGEGGVDIETVAAQTPELIHKEWIDPRVGLQGFQSRRLAFHLGLSGKTVRSFGKVLSTLVKVYEEKDASMVEINPLVITGEGSVVALDAKLTFDGNGLFRHPDIVAYRDLDEEDPLEVRANDLGLNYIKLDGNVGCMVNGAGLAMATMDILQTFGAQPANFLDVGGGATKEMVMEAFKILVEDQVSAIFVNIFGGIMKCDVIAEGIVAAAAEVGLTVPLIVRLAGTNVEQGREILASSGLAITPAATMKDGAQLAAQSVGRA